jgi:APA family basic amino acid/polyamine antiporter
MALDNPKNKIGLWATTSLVVGNMIASGVFMLPVALAKFGAVSIVGWIVSSIGAITFALLFSILSKRIKNTVGGPYAFTREGLGEFPAFLVAWGYWLSCCITISAITVTFISYSSVFLPVLANNPLVAIIAGLCVIWFLTWINTRGVKTAGGLQLITTIMKVTPLILVSMVGLFYVDINNFIPFNRTATSNFSAILATTTLTLFAFIGLESATVPAKNVVDPQRTIPKATMVGSLITMGIYMLSSITIMGMMPGNGIVTSNAAFADAAAILWGEPGRYGVAIGAILSTFGALNGWILIQGQIPFAASSDKIFPAIFQYQNNKGVPITGMIFSSILVSCFMMMNFTSGLSETFGFLILLSTLIVLIPYLFSATSLAVILLQDKLWKQKLVSKIIIALVAFGYSLWAIAGSGEKAVYWGLLGLFAGIPFYVLMKRSKAGD